MADSNWRERYGVPNPPTDAEWRRPGDSGLIGAATQERIIREYVAQSVEKDDRDYSRKTFLDWSWLRVERHFGDHFDEQEMVIELKLPWSRSAPGAFGYNRRLQRSYVVVFGRVHTRLTTGAWHMRGAPAYWDRNIF
jgi:hypothetical protein